MSDLEPGDKVRTYTRKTFTKGTEPKLFDEVFAISFIKKKKVIQGARSSITRPSDVTPPLSNDRPWLTTGPPVGPELLGPTPGRTALFSFFFCSSDSVLGWSDRNFWRDLGWSDRTFFRTPGRTAHLCGH